MAVLPTLVYCYSISQLGNPVGNLDVPGITGSYLGLILLGGVFASIGILASSLSENQIIAFIIAVFLSFFLYSGVDSMAGLFSGQLSLYIEEMSLIYHFDAMGRGLIDTRNIVYFVSTGAVMLLLTHLRMSSRFFSFRSMKNRIWQRFVLALIVLLIFNIVAANVYWRIDLTEDKRFTLKPATRELLSQLDQPMTFEILLAGDLPPKYQRLNKALIQTIKEFDSRSSNFITYFLTDPSDADTPQEQNENFQYLMGNGLSPTRAVFNENGNQVTKIVFPYVILRYNNQAAAISISDDSRVGITPDELINQSIENLEFNLAVGIQRLAKLDRKRIGLIHGHGELDSLDIVGFQAEMVQYFNIEPIDLPEVEAIQSFDAVIVPKPVRPYSTADKYKLDQYLMNGGKAIFLIDALQADMASAGGSGTVGLPVDHDLDDLLFRYGIRLNKNYVQDRQNLGRYPVEVNESGNIINLPWPFFASINDFTTHPITKNLDAVYARTFGTIDTVKAEGVKKTPLMFTSPYTRVISTPARVAFEDYATEPDINLFNHGREAVAYLLEGEFTSLFKNRVLNQSQQASFKESSVSTKIIVTSDGDLIRNELKLGEGTPYELGFNPFADQGEKVRYANKDFLFNALAYLTDENGLNYCQGKRDYTSTLEPRQSSK